MDVARHTYSFHDGYPVLCAGVSFSSLLNDAISGCARDLEDDPCCFVDWGDCDEECAFTLSMRFRGHEVFRKSGSAQHALVLHRSCVPAAILPGEALVLELRWEFGSRHLHLIPDIPPSCLTCTSLVSVPLSTPESDHAALDSVVCSPDPRLPRSLAPVVERGFGIELEMVTSARAEANGGGARCLRDVIASHIDAIERRGDSSARTLAALARARQWTVGEDSAICGCPDEVAESVLDICSPVDRERARTLLLAVARLTDPTEVRSPAPPHELSFASGAAEEIRCLVQLLRTAGAATPSVGRVYGTVEPRGSACDAGTSGETARAPSEPPDAPPWPSPPPCRRHSEPSGLRDAVSSARHPPRTAGMGGYGRPSPAERWAPVTVPDRP